MTHLDLDTIAAFGSRFAGILGRVSYDEVFEALAGVYLEDSWILEVVPRVDGVAFRIEAVLTSEHSSYEAPRPNEQYCYRAGWLDVQGEEPVEVHLSGSTPATSADGSIDLGNIDRFTFEEADNRWEMEGDWGIALVSGPVVTLIFD